VLARADAVAAAAAVAAFLLFFFFFYLTAEQRLPMGHCFEISSLYRNTDVCAIDVVVMVVVVIVIIVLV